MKKMIIGLVVLGLTGCGMSHSEIRQHPTRTFTTSKTPEQMMTCVIPKLDSRTFNGIRANTVVKPTDNGVVLSPLAGNIEFIDVTKTNNGSKVIYYGEATKKPLIPDIRISEVIEDINSCL